MNKNILIFFIIIFITSGMFASQQTEGKYLTRQIKSSLKRSSLFEPSSIEDEDFNIDVLSKQDNQLQTAEAILPTSGNYYFSKSRLPWKFGELKQKDNVLSAINTAIRENDNQALANLLQEQDLSKVTKFNDNPLITAILFNRVNMILPLVAAGADVLMKNDDGDDVIKFAYDVSNQVMVQELLKAQGKYMNRFATKSPTTRTASVSPYFFDQD